MNFFRCSGDSEGATATAGNYVRPNPHNDQRQPHKITVENYTNPQNATHDSSCAAAKGILPFGSRETTLMNAAAATGADDTKSIEEKGFIYGNPFVEVTKGIIHIYKKE